MRPLLALALFSLAACGGTLYTSEGLPALPIGPGNQCTDPAAPMSCDLGAGPVCVAHDAAHCASCTDACPASPANGQQQCLESAAGAGDWACHLDCSAGFLRTGASCSRASAVAAGDAHACALAGGLVKCWGANGAGQVSGAPSSGDVLVPFDLASGATLLAAGGTSTCAVIGGAVSCWGAVASPSASLSIASPVALAVGASHACALLAAPGGIKCWGLGAAATAAPTATTFLAVSAGANHACALDAAGAVTCWGKNDQGQLGGGLATAESHTPFASGMAAVGAGHDQACAAGASGTKNLQCWGNGAAPAQNAKVRFDANAIAPGRAHVCVHRPAESVQCFGDNSLGQLGQANVLPGELSTVPGALSDAYAIATGADHACAVFPDGSVQCWGANASGQLGGGSTAAAAVGRLITVSGR